MITLEELKRLLIYNPETGEFINLIDRGRSRAGQVVGSYSGNGYISIKLNYERYYAHRLAWFYMTGEWPENEIDHINCITDDNRWCNLRQASRVENSYNSSIRSHNKTGYKGVYKHKDGKYIAQIIVNRKKINLGSYVTPEEAKIKYDEAALIYHKEFASL